MNVQSHRLQRTQERRARDARRGKLGKGRFDAVSQRLSFIIRESFDAGHIASMFGLEGTFIHGIRADLCRQGWKWADANDMARELVANALWRANAHRPAWNEGQPDWAISAGTLIERTLCVRCKKALPEGHYKFCSDICASSHHRIISASRDAAEGEAYDKVVKFYFRRGYID